jgi:predicted transcriptional regulator
MSILEERILKIICLRNSKKDTQEIAEELQLEPYQILNDEVDARQKIRRARQENLIVFIEELDKNPALIDYIKEYIREPPVLTRDERYERIQTALEHGVYRMDALRLLVGYSLSTLYKLKYEQEIDISAELRKNLNEKIIKLHKDGISIEGIVAETHSSLNKVRRCLMRIDTVKRDALVCQGLSIPKIADAEGVTKQAISQYIKITRQRKAWKQKRKEAQQTEQARNAFMNLLNNKACKMVRMADWAGARTEEYMQVRTRAPREKVHKVYDEYHQAKIKGEKPSYRQLAKKAGCNFTYVMGLLHFAGLKPLYTEYHECETPVQTMIQISRTGLTPPDIAYFCGMSENGVRLRFSEAGFRQRRNNTKLNKSMPKLTYRLASEIYEAADLGFAYDEISELLDARINVVEYAMRRRRELAPTITAALRLMYPDCRKPYR